MSGARERETERERERERDREKETETPKDCVGIIWQEKDEAIWRIQIFLYCASAASKN